VEARGIEPTTNSSGISAISDHGGAKSGAPADAGELLTLWVMLTNDQRGEVLALARRLAVSMVEGMDQSPLTTKGGAQ
jgi:hypothetical protein